MIHKGIFQVIIVGLMLMWPVSVLKSQEMLGISQSNYSGLMSSRINPALMQNSHNYLEFNVITVGSFAQNNFAYIPAGDIQPLQLLFGNTNFPTYGEDQNNFLYYQNNDLKKASSVQQIIGPSAMLTSGEQTFALTTAVRSYSSAIRLPYEVPVLGYEGLSYEPLQNILFDDYDAHIANANWAEIGFSYARVIQKSGFRRFHGGISLKLLLGHSGGFASIGNLKHIVVNDSTINIVNLDADLGYSIPLDYEINEYTPSPLFRGSGLSTDIGFTFVNARNGYQNLYGLRNCEIDFEPYYFKLGVSLIDMGYLRFNTNAARHRYDNVETYWTNLDTTNYTNLDLLAKQFSYLFYEDSTASLAGNSITIGLPTAFSMQLDINILKNYYLSAIWIHPIKISKYQMYRFPVLAVTPRIETRLFELSLPLSLYDYELPRIGFAARFAFFSIGSDRIGTWMGFTDFNGYDLYMSVRFTIGKGNCLKGKGSNYCTNGEYGLSQKDRKRFR